MKQKSKTITFFGSGDVAAKSLELLAQSFEIEAVITKPQPAHHKEIFPVISVAKKLNLKLLYVTNKKELSALFATHPVTSDLAVLIDFGIIVAQDVIDYFPLGIVNSHFSLLPEWRGADPITFSILSGQQKTGVCLMLLVAGLDEGPILAVGEFDLNPEITTPVLTDSLIQLSYSLLQNTIPDYMNGKVTSASQEHVAKLLGHSQQATYSRKLEKEDGNIDWDKPADQIEREIRAYAEWPKSRTKLGDVSVVIISSSVVKQRIGKPGEIVISDKELFVACGTDALKIISLKPAGKNEMPAQAFLAGYSNRLS